MSPAAIAPQVDNLVEVAHSRYLAEFDRAKPGTLNAPWDTLSPSERDGLRAIVLFVYGQAVEDFKGEQATTTEQADDTFQFDIGQWVEVDGRTRRGKIVARIDVAEADEPGYRVMWVYNDGEIDHKIFTESELFPTGEEA